MFGYKFASLYLLDGFLEGDLQKDLGKSSNNLNALFKSFFFFLSRALLVME